MDLFFLVTRHPSSPVRSRIISCVDKVIMRNHIVVFTLLYTLLSQIRAERWLRGGVPAVAEQWPAQNSQKSQEPMHRQRQVALWSPLTSHASQNGNPSSRETLPTNKEIKERKTAECNRIRHLTCAHMG